MRCINQSLGSGLPIQSIIKTKQKQNKKRNKKKREEEGEGGGGGGEEERIKVIMSLLFCHHQSQWCSG